MYIYGDLTLLALSLPPPLDHQAMTPNQTFPSGGVDDIAATASVLVRTARVAFLSAVCLTSLAANAAIVRYEQVMPTVQKTLVTNSRKKFFS